MAAFNVSYIPFLKLLEGSIYYLNQFIKKIASFEDFIFTNISLSQSMMFGLYLMLFCWILFCKKPSAIKLYASLLSILCVQLIYIQSKISTQKSSEFLVLSSKKNTLFIERCGNISTIFATDSILKLTNKNSTISPFLIGSFTDSVIKKQISNLYYFKNKKILVFDDKIEYTNDNPDVLILSHSPKINLERYFLNHKPEIVIIDNSNFKSYIKVWKKTCEQQKIRFHDIAENGFYRL